MAKARQPLESRSIIAIAAQKLILDAAMEEKPILLRWGSHSKMSATAGPRTMRCMRFIIVTICALLCGGCFLTSSPRLTSASLPLESSWRGIALTKVSDNPWVYRVNQEAKNEIFITAIRECGYSAVPAPEAAARRLLIGLRDVTYLEAPAEVADADSPFAWKLRAMLGDMPLLVNVISEVDENNCVLDHVLWTRADQAPQKPPPEG
jgi:hypothetical protein